MEGLPESQRDPAAFTACVLTTDLRRTGQFRCSDERVNQLQSNIQWSQQDNFLEVPTDCPQRSERLGWTGDIRAYGCTALFNSDAALFLKKWLRDLAADQGEDGAVPYVVPDVLDAPGQPVSTASFWGDSAVVLPWEIYMASGDRAVLREQYPSMKAWNVILYQSMSGDSEVGNSTFEMVGGSLTAQNGGMFYTTNTESTFVLSGVEITNAADSEFLLKCTGNSNQRGWGTAGANGADCHFTAIDQVLEGDVIWDSISQLDFYLTDGSTLTGAFVQDESNAGNGGDGYANLYLSADSTWVVTGDSTLTSLSCAGTIVDDQGNPVSVVGTDGTVYVSGNSAYTVTVETYTDSADLAGASSLDSWVDCEAEKI